MFTEAYCIVHGKVQGVAYRDFAERAAKHYAVTGWVRNKEDGTVEVLAQGMPEELKAFVEELHEGSVLARVDSVSVEWRSPLETFADFSVLY